TPRAGEARSIADQATDGDEFAREVDGWNGMACRQSHEMFASVVEHRIGADDEPAGVLLDQRRESRVDLGFVVGLQYMELHPLHAGRLLHVWDHGLGASI